MAFVGSYCPWPVLLGQYEVNACPNSGLLVVPTYLRSLDDSEDVHVGETSFHRAAQTCLRVRMS